MAAVDPISAGIQVGTATAMTIAQINDINKRRQFEQALSLLSNRQQNELNNLLLQANTQTDRLRILSESMTNYLVQNQNAAARNNIILYAVAAVVSLGILITVMAMDKKN